MTTDELEYGAITIDTSIFDKFGLRLEVGLFEKLQQFKHGKVNLIFSDIILGEVKSHLIDEIKKSKHIVTSATKASFEHLNFNHSEVEKAKALLLGGGSSEEIAEQRISTFLKNCSSTVINSKDYVDVERLIKSYFDPSPPFSDKKGKKHEFPDAIALISIENWAKINGKKVLSVADDGDWDLFCEHSEFIDIEKDLSKALNIFHSHLFSSAALNKLALTFSAGKDNDLIKSIESFLESKVENFDIWPEASSPDYFESEVNEVSFQYFEPIYDKDGSPVLRVIEVEDEHIVIDLLANIKIGISCSFSFSVKDPVDKDYIDVGSFDTYKEEDFQTNILLTGYLENEDDLSSFNIEEIELSEELGVVDFGTIEISDMYSHEYYEE
jgi:hypothetical protein